MTKSDRNSEAPEGKGRGNATSKSNGHSTTDAPTAQGQEVPGRHRIRDFTLVSDSLVERYDLQTAAVYGRVYLFCNRRDGVCYATVSTIAKGIGLGYNTVLRRLKLLCEEGYLVDETPGLRNAPHTYRLTGKLEVEHVSETRAKETPSSTRAGDEPPHLPERETPHLPERETPHLPEREMNRTVGGCEEEQQHGDAAGDDPLSERQRQAFDALLRIGFEPKADAERYARGHDPGKVLGWIERARSRGDVDNPAGYVRAMLDKGASPPAPSEPEARASNSWRSGKNNATVNRLVEETLQDLEGDEPPRVVVERLAGLGPLAELVKASLRERGVELPEPEATGGDR